MAEFRRQIASHAIVGLDTSIFIYHFEDHAAYKPLTKIILQGVQAGEREAVLSTVALMELTVHPWLRNRPDIARRYEALLIHFPHLQLADVTRHTARQAAQLRAKFNIRPADALNVAAVLVNGATAYITNDKELNRLAPVLDIFVLDSFVYD